MNLDIVDHQVFKTTQMYPLHVLLLVLSPLDGVWGILVAKNLENLEKLKMFSNIVRLQDNMLFDQNTWVGFIKQ